MFEIISLKNHEAVGGLRFLWFAFEGVGIRGVYNDVGCFPENNLPGKFKLEKLVPACSRVSVCSIPDLCGAATACC